MNLILCLPFLVLHRVILMVFKSAIEILMRYFFFLIEAIQSSAIRKKKEAIAQTHYIELDAAFKGKFIFQTIIRFSHRSEMISSSIQYKTPFAKHLIPCRDKRTVSTNKTLYKWHWWKL